MYYNQDLFENFIYELREAYLDCRNPKTYSNSDYSTLNLKRGRNHSASSIAEDYVACLIIKELQNKDVFVFVDQPITIKDKEFKKKVIYPDIMICKMINEETFKCYYMCDIKTDAGYIRNKYNILSSDHFEKLSLCKSNKSCLSHMGENKKSFKIMFDMNAKYDVVILMSTNGLLDVKQLEEQTDKKYRTENNDTNCLLLSEGQHVNNYDDNFDIKKIKPSTDYNIFFKRIKTSINKKQ